MTLIQIDETKCKQDGFCVKECPAAIIKMKDKDSFPMMVEHGAQACLLCGHCIAVCPHDALTHTAIPMETSPLILKDNAITEDQATQFMRSRRSIRRFKDKSVEKETVQSIIDNARYAPTGGNTQLLKWTVFTEKTKIKVIADLTIDWMRQAIAADSNNTLAAYLPMVVAAYDAGMDSITQGAPCLVFASAPGQYPNGMVDLSLALSYFELAAVSKGMGTCWMGLIFQALKHSAPLQEAVGLSKSHTHFYPMILGYPKFKYHRVPERKAANISWK